MGTSVHPNIIYKYINNIYVLLFLACISNIINRVGKNTCGICALSFLTVKIDCDMRRKGKVQMVTRKWTAPSVHKVQESWIRVFGTHRYRNKVWHEFRGHGCSTAHPLEPKEFWHFSPSLDRDWCLRTGLVNCSELYCSPTQFLAVKSQYGHKVIADVTRRKWPV